MAGGFGSRGAPLYARTRAGPASAGAFGAGDVEPPNPPLLDGDERPDCPARHCWVTAPVDGGVPRPGLLLEWRRGAQGWEGRVVYAAELRAHRWGAVEEWLPAEVVASVERGTPPQGHPGPI
jgi:hypothetical protein